jgi:hypothetical protein
MRQSWPFLTISSSAARFASDKTNTFFFTIIRSPLVGPLAAYTEKLLVDRLTHAHTPSDPLVHFKDWAEVLADAKVPLPPPRWYCPSFRSRYSMDTPQLLPVSSVCSPTSTLTLLPVSSTRSGPLAAALGLGISA